MRPAFVRSLPSMAFLKSSRSSSGMGFDGADIFDLDILGLQGFSSTPELLRGGGEDIEVKGRSVFGPCMVFNGTRGGGAIVAVAVAVCGLLSASVFAAAGQYEVENGSKGQDNPTDSLA